MPFSLDQLYDLPPGATVEIQLKKTTLRGKFTLVSNGLIRNRDLDQVQMEGSTELPSGKKRFGVVCFPVKEIVNLKVIEFGIFKKKEPFQDPVPSPIPQSKISPIRGGKAKAGVITKQVKIDEDLKNLEPVEVLLRTHVIRTEPDLKLLLKLIKEENVCGLSLEGENVSRHGVVAWIILVAGKTLLPIDIDTLIWEVPDLWKMLNTNIFGNPKLVKILHEVGHAADYLLNVHGIEMVNVFDTQVADAFIYFNRNHAPPPQLNPLSDSLQIHNRRIPVDEIEFLRKYEKEDYSTNSPMLKKPLPPPEYVKWCALKVKHLVPLRENLLKEANAAMGECMKTQVDYYALKPEQEREKMAKNPRLGLSKKLVAKLEEGLGHLKM